MALQSAQKQTRIATFLGAQTSIDDFDTFFCSKFFLKLNMPDTLVQKSAVKAKKSNLICVLVYGTKVKNYVFYDAKKLQNEGFYLQKC